MELRKSFLIYMGMLSAIQHGPAVYKDIKCVEPEPGYVLQLIRYFTATEIQKECPAPEDIAWRFGYEVICIVVCVLLTQMIAYAPSIGNTARRSLSKARNWIKRPWRCRYCGSAPCQVLRKSTSDQLVPRREDSGDHSERSNAMMLFNCGLEVSTLLSKELPQDDLYWERRFCRTFEEKHLCLFPLCIQRHINSLYPAPN
ncbi:uncharacterized protein LOC117321779 [Pecten maximus]|uniref:uncharacterized protein LOC117321779 n=1 Tax=Pecten maximus TaxID=6579 RepID=UPI0014588C60|nr:uncharacterized protein LOC117321779 [Pecten maximus]